MSAAQHFHLDGDESAEALEAAARALDAGELVVVPTETVYGVAARADRPAGLERLSALKEGRTNPYSVAVQDPDQVAEQLLPPSRLALRVAARWWPGPVTQVLPRRDGGTLGVRVPGQPWTRELAGRTGPLLLPSANGPGQPAPRDTDELSRAVLDAVAVVVHGGHTALGEASTVVASGLAALSVLREGVVSRADLAAHALGRVLIVCSGNTCRSPMASALLEQAFARRVAHTPGLLAPEILSAGLFAGPGSPASRHAVQALARRDLDIADHASRPLDPTLLEHVDLVLGMTPAHVEGLRSWLGDLDVPVALLDPDGGAIDDPFGGSLGTYEQCAEALAAHAAVWAERLDPTPRTDTPAPTAGGSPQETP